MNDPKAPTPVQQGPEHAAPSTSAELVALATQCRDLARTVVNTDPLSPSLFARGFEIVQPSPEVTQLSVPVMLGILKRNYFEPGDTFSVLVLGDEGLTKVEGPIKFEEPE